MQYFWKQKTGIPELFLHSRGRGLTKILVTHNMGVASYLSDKIGVMKDSRLVEFGTREEIIFHPKEQYTRELLDAVPKLGGDASAE